MIFSRPPPIRSTCKTTGTFESDAPPGARRPPGILQPFPGSKCPGTRGPNLPRPRPHRMGPRDPRIWRDVHAIIERQERPAPSRLVFSAAPGNGAAGISRILFGSIPRPEHIPPEGPISRRSRRCRGIQRIRVPGVSLSPEMNRFWTAVDPPDEEHPAYGRKIENPGNKTTISGPGLATPRCKEGSES